MTYVKPVTYLYPKPVLPLNASICVPCPHVSHPSLYVTEFAKMGLIHASNFSTLRMCNSASIGPTALIFGNKSFLSLY